MLQSVFDPDNLFFRILSKGVDFVGLSLLWAALSLPVITIGPATAALYYTVVKTFRHKKDRAFRMYLKSFRNNLRRGIPATLICIPIAAFLGWGYNVMGDNISTSQGVVMFMTYHVLMVVPVGVVCYLFPMLGRFELGVKALFLTAATLALRHLPSTVIVVLLVVQLVIFTIEQWWPILFVPVLTVLLVSLFLERIFPKYLSEEEAAILADKDELED